MEIGKLENFRLDEQYHLLDWKSKSSYSRYLVALLLAMYNRFKTFIDVPQPM